MKFALHIFVSILGMLAASLWLSASAGKTQPWPIAFPSDLGPETVDVSRYPSDLQAVYRGVFQKRCVTCHAAARALNSPLLELEPKRIAQLEAAHSPLLKDEKLAKVGPEVWKIYLKQMRQRPACCGGCSAMTDSEMKEIYRFVRYDSVVRKSGRNTLPWIARRKALIKKYAAFRRALEEEKD
jgi:hypothetical protein